MAKSVWEVLEITDFVQSASDSAVKSLLILNREFIASKYCL